MLDKTETPRGLARWYQIGPAERRVLVLAFAYFFFLLASYYVLRPVRDEMAVRSGVRSIPWLFTATFVVSLAIAPIYGFLVAKLRRGVFIPLVYGFLALNILAFWALLSGGIALDAAAKAFFVWLSVFNVFAVSVFWSFMADLFEMEQAKRLYPLIAAGGSLGGLAGSVTVTGLVTAVGPANLLLIAAGLLLAALALAVRLDHVAREVGTSTKAPRTRREGTGGGWLAGLTEIVRSPYLAGIAVWVFALSLAGTFAYNMQIDIVGRSGLDSAGRTQIFGTVDLATNILIPLIQLTIARAFLQRLGVGVTLSVVAVVFLIGFATLSAAPILAVLVAFQVAQRTGQFALSNPAREALFTVVGPEETYKAKNVIDNAVFRGSDVTSAWLFNLLNSGLGLGLSALALIGAGAAAAWAGISLALGEAQKREAARHAHAQGDPT
ncbi:MAG TPA: MFS transporter [Beijerinckiaceae bacterium]|nr:MFS transporter [Beijerinckiaceae bacterium]